MPKHDLIIIGAGPGGYVAAIRAAQLGLDVACIDENERLGGTCLRVGCIPSKALLESSEKYVQTRDALKEHGIEVSDVKMDVSALLKRKDRIVQTLTRGVASLLKKNKVTHYHGRGAVAGQGKVTFKPADGSDEQTLDASHILIATGSVSATLPGVELDGDRVGTSTEALGYNKPPQHLVVIGGGYIGLEMASVWNRLGSQVTVLEYLDRILPGLDEQIAGEAQKLLEKQGLTFRLGVKVTGARAVDKKGCIVEYEGGEPIEADRVLLAVGRRPNTANLDLEQAGVKLDKAGRIEVDDRFQTSVEGIYAIGDVIRGPMLAHKAEQEGIACVEQIVTGYGHVDYDSIPAVVYTHPEIASVGKTEEQLKQAGIDYDKGMFPFRGNGRARTLGDVEGQVKILADAKTDRILGVHIIGNRAGDLIAEAAAAMAYGASAEDLARVSHAHPTLAEAVKEAALAVDGRAVHV